MSNDARVLYPMNFLSRRSRINGLGGKGVRFQTEKKRYLKFSLITELVNFDPCCVFIFTLRTLYVSR